jgi:hypothetical protein
MKPEIQYLKIQPIRIFTIVWNFPGAKILSCFFSAVGDEAKKKFYNIDTRQNAITHWQQEAENIRQNYRVSNLRFC